MGLPSSGRFFQGGYRDFRQLPFLSAGSLTSPPSPLSRIQNHGTLHVDRGRRRAQGEEEDTICCAGLCAHQPGPSASGDGEQAVDCVNHSLYVYFQLVVVLPDPGGPSLICITLLPAFFHSPTGFWILCLCLSLC